MNCPAAEQRGNLSACGGLKTWLMITYLKKSRSRTKTGGLFIYGSHGIGFSDTALWYSENQCGKVHLTVTLIHAIHNQILENIKLRVSTACWEECLFIFQEADRPRPAGLRRGHLLIQTFMTLFDREKIILILLIDHLFIFKKYHGLKAGHTLGKGQDMVFEWGNIFLYLNICIGK